MSLKSTQWTGKIFCQTKSSALTFFLVFLAVLTQFQLGHVNAQVQIPVTALTTDTPGKIDPADAYDSLSIDVIQQICEGLYAYNLSSPEMEVIPRLASQMGEWSPDGLNLTINIRTDATWHDGTDVTAAQIKWNFDRIFDFAVNFTGAAEDTSTPAVLYVNDDGDAIVNETLVVNADTIKFILNKPWTVWEKLIAFSGSYVIKPDIAYEHIFVPLTNYTDIIGTGPFKLESITPDIETVFVSNEEYYRGAPNIKKMVYLAVDDPDTASLAMLNHEVHYGPISPEYMTLAREDPTITIQPVKKAITRYIQFNMGDPNLTYTLRRAMSFAFNYPYYINEVEGGDDYELHVPIPDGMEFHNPNIEGLPYFNKTFARRLIVDDPVYFDNQLTAYAVDHPWIDWNDQNLWDNDEVWNEIAINPAYNIGEFTFTRYTSGFMQRLLTAVQDSMIDIGIRIIDDNLGDWAIIHDWFEPDKASWQLSLGGWGPDYNDPINMIEPIFKTNASFNDMYLSNATIDNKMNLTYTLTGDARRAAFNDLQKDIAVYNVPCFYFMQDGGYIMWDNERLSNVDDFTNSLGYWDFYHVIYEGIELSDHYYEPEPDPPRKFLTPSNLIFIFIVGLLWVFFMIWVISKSLTKETKMENGQRFREKNRQKTLWSAEDGIKLRETLNKSNFSQSEPNGIHYCPDCGGLCEKMDRFCQNCGRSFFP